MSMEEFSPAPFMLRSRPPKGEDRGGHLIVDAMGDGVAALAWQTGDHPAEEQLANARLFTAAPTMLHALRDAEEFIQSVDPTSYTLADVRAAIASAEGRE